ncbi:Outer membrane protein beta-barrel domain-containing protein [Belliella buryatensis]|uniref:Outer membrane protein beta-barrel domain-containing protein n=1 Tax=Belliella buryatensis TaxID=1500549 RepID=A0A239AMV0_9BACT|nr:outer membrane beta-barrel protein [Belliella buryatensis]SNR96652.1 Outer membrane protein beta-barrel domain-containing protein [Belliella buryatensis]
MKKLVQITLVLISMLFFSTEINAQSKTGWGIKGGLNYNSNGKYFRDAELVLSDPLNNWGYNVGLFGKIEVGPLFVRPELAYTQLNSEINSTQLRTERLDMPLLVGLNVLGPVVSFFGGPALHYTIQDDLKSLEYDKYNMGYQFGIGLNFNNLGLDIRYERELNDQKINIDNVFTGQGDFKYQQITLNMSIKF